jgi:hypothetical protein
VRNQRNVALEHLGKGPLRLSRDAAHVNTGTAMGNLAGIQHVEDADALATHLLWSRLRGTRLQL